MTDFATDTPAREGALILVDGIDGSGKSRFAARLHEALLAAGEAAALVAVDDFRRPVDWNDPRGEAAVYHDDYFDLAAAGARVAALRADGRTVVLEGVFTRRVAGASAAPLLWLEVSPAEAERRIVARDTARGRSEAEVRHRIRARYVPGQDRYRAELAPAAHAALVVDNDDPARPRLRHADWTLVTAPVAAALRALLDAA